MDKIGEILFPEIDQKKRKEIISKWGQSENSLLQKKGGSLYPELKETLEQLSQKFPLFIVSNCQEGYIESFLEFYQFEAFFTDFENPGRTGLSKGENIKLVIERNQLKDAVYVGDTNWDQEAAVYAGIPFVYASYGFGQVDHCDYKIDSFADLKKLFL